MVIKMKMIDAMKCVLVNCAFALLDAITVTVPGTEEWSVKYRRY